MGIYTSIAVKSPLACGCFIESYGESNNPVDYQVHLGGLNSD